MNTVFPSRYEAYESLIHRLDPRVKVVTAVLVIVGINATPERAWVAYPLLWTVIGSLAAVSRFGAWRLSRLAGLVLPFTLSAAALLVTTPGHPIVTVGGLPITDGGLERFVAIVLKSWLSMQAALLLTTTTHFTDLLWALQSLRVPETLVAIVGFMVRYLSTLKEEADRLLRSRSARSGTVKGSRSGGSLLWRAQVAGGMVGSLFLRSYERSDRVYAAMLARGYNGQVKHMETSPPARSNVLLGAVLIAIVVLIQVAARLWRTP
jgi:cobalt/nickel transport system permease protein